MQIGIIGTGMVGSAIAYSLASEGSAEKLILIDANKERAIAEAMDISHSTPFTFGARVVAGDYKDLKDAGIIVITAGANQKPGETRLDLLENKVVLCVPEGSDKGIDSFDALAEHLKAEDILFCMGNSDVPVGQYTQKILSYYSLDEAALAAAGVITYGSNVKEVTTQISEGSVDAGVVYCTDAYSAGLAPVDEATAEMCGQVIYPAAVLKAAPHPDAAVAFLAYLRTDAAAQVFESVGFAAV